MKKRLIGLLCSAGLLLAMSACGTSHSNVTTGLTSRLDGTYQLQSEGDALNNQQPVTGVTRLSFDDGDNGDNAGTFAYVDADGATASGTFTLGDPGENTGTIAGVVTASAGVDAPDVGDQIMWLFGLENGDTRLRTETRYEGRTSFETWTRVNE